MFNIDMRSRNYDSYLTVISIYEAIVINRGLMNPDTAIMQKLPKLLL